MANDIPSNIGRNTAQNPVGGGISAGAKRVLFQNDKKMESIFDAIDKDKNGVIDEKEYNQYFDKDGDGTVTEKETKKGLDFLNKLLGQNAKAEGQKFGKEQKVTQKDLEKFLGICGTNSADVKSVQHSQQDGKDVVVIDYNNGDKDIVSTTSKSYIHEGSNEALCMNGTTTYNEDGICSTFEGMDNDNNKVTINFAEDGIHYDTMRTESDIEIPGEDGTEATTLKQTETTTFVPGSDNIPEQTVITYPDKPADKTTIKYENGTVSNIEIQSGTTLSNFTLDEQGNKIPQQIIMNKGLPTQQTTTYTYGENITEIRTVDIENKPVETQTFDKEKGTITTRTYGASAGDVESYTETVVTNESATKSEYVDGYITSQTLTTKDGKQYHADYDGNGNTKITIQENESLDKIAKKFGCSVNDLKKLNPDLGNKLIAGNTMIVPGQLEPDDAKLIVRKSPEQIKADQTERQRKAQQRLQAEKADVQRSLTHKVYDTKLYGKPKTVLDLASGKNKTYTIVGKNQDGGYFLRDKEGNFFAQPKPDSPIAVPIRKGGAEDFNKLSGCIYTKHPQLGLVAEIRTNSAGSKIFQDRYGNQYVQDRYDEKLVPKGKDQVQQDLSRFLDKEAGEIRRSMALLKENQTWSQKLGEYMASSVTSKGTTAGLNKEMKQYEQKLAMLRECVNDGDTEGFKILFKEIFNMPYSEKNVRSLLSAVQSGDTAKVGQLRSQTMKGPYGNMQSHYDAVASQNEIGGYVVEGSVTLLTMGVGTEIQVLGKGGQLIVKGSEEILDVAQEFGNLSESQRNAVLSGDGAALVSFAQNYAISKTVGNFVGNGLDNTLDATIKRLPNNKLTQAAKDVFLDDGSSVSGTMGNKVWKEGEKRYIQDPAGKSASEQIPTNILISDPKNMLS